MKINQSQAPKDTAMTVRLPSQIVGMLDALAHNTRRSKAYLAGEAITSYVEQNAWQVARIAASLEEAKSGTPGIPHAEVERWVNSWDTPNELTRPEAHP